MATISHRLSNGWKILKETFVVYWQKDTSTLAAALSYYTIFAIAPAVIIVIAIAGVILGPRAVQGEVNGQLQSILGTKSAVMVEEMIKAVYRPGQNIPAAIASIAFLIIGAIAVFGQLRISLDTIWEVKERAKKPLLDFFLRRMFSIGMVVMLAFLLLISLIIHAGLEAFSYYLQYRVYYLSVLIFQVLNLTFSIALTWLLFALIYKFMSDAKLLWRDACLGALFTTFLFTIGKYLLGLYLGRNNVVDTYGAAGSVLAILIWVFYSSKIVFFGAVFTQIIDKHHLNKLNRQWRIR